MSQDQFFGKKGQDLDEYISNSAGFTDNADTKKIYVIKPNGQAERQSGLWSFKRNFAWKYNTSSKKN